MSNLIANSDIVQTETQKVRRVLVVEDDEGLNRLSQKALNKAGFETKGVLTGAEAIEQVMTDSDLALLLDQQLPDMTGTELIRTLMKHNRKVPFVAMTGHGDELIAVEMMKLGAKDYLIKSLDLTDLLPVVFNRVFHELETERRLVSAEKALIEANGIINRSPAVAFLWKNAEGWPVDFVSENVEELFGYSAYEFTSGKVSYAKIIHPDDFERVAEEVTVFGKGKDRKGFVHDPYRIITKSGEVKWLDDRTYIRRNGKGVITHFEGIVVDITNQRALAEEKKKIESQLRKAQKLESIGTLAGGIAHDFNNILGAIIGFSELIKYTKLPKSSDLHSDMDQILKAANRAKGLVKQILAFSRQVEQKEKPILVLPIIRETLKLLRASLPTTIEISEDIDKIDATIIGDPSQIHQIIMNLCTNAAHAMQETGGVLEVNLRELVIEEQQGGTLRDLKPGSYIYLGVSDTGPGIAADIIERIFDPYFTTKQKGDGTGLGLAVVHGIVKSHAGEIIVDSRKGSGTIFHVYLPMVEERLSAETKKEEPIPTGQGRILFIDDENALAQIGKRMLEGLGYEVETRTSSLEALELFRIDPYRFDLVVTDMTMPNMTGVQLAQELIRTRPEIPIILCTGFSERMNRDTLTGSGIKKLLMKPLSTKEIALSVKKCLPQK